MIKKIKQKFTFFGMVTPTKYASRETRLWALGSVVACYIAVAIVILYVISI